MVDVDTIADEVGFSGAVRVDQGGATVFAKAYGLAHRALGIPNTLDTRFAMASGSKAFTALAVLSLVEDGVLELATPARAFLGDQLPLVSNDVTLEHLLSHRSGIGDYLDEEAIDDVETYFLPISVQELAEPESYVPLLEGHPQRFEPGERFEYNNAAFVMLALIAERASGVAFHDLVQQRVLDRAGLRATAYLRSDELPGNAAVGYLRDGLRTNVFHLPVRGGGDGGAYTTVADVHAFWRALFDGAIVSPATLAEMIRPRGNVTADALDYGLGLWLRPALGAVLLEGADVGVSFRSWHQPGDELTWTVVSNTSDGAWPVARALAH